MSHSHSQSLPVSLLAWMVLQTIVWGQATAPSNAILQRNASVRVHGPSAVVQASAHSATAPLSASKLADEPIPMRGASDLPVHRISAPRSPWSATLSTIFSLMVVVFLFLIAALVVRKSQPKQFQKLPKDVLDVLGRTSIAPRQSLILMRFGSKLILVSQQPGETRTICEIQEASEVARLAGLCESSKPESITSSFREVMRQVSNPRPSQQT
jgi:flagellar biogenesis protein FliO